jgi:TM2 domain-containing membrane protein YozV
MRVGDDERRAAAASLGEHYAHGRLDAQEYEERVTAAYTARTAGELERLFSDLPRPAPIMPPVHLVPAADPYAPYGRHPVTGVPYSDRSKILAGLLQLLLPFGIGRFYTGHYGVAVAQLLTSMIAIGVFWSWIDGIVLLAGRPNDPFGRPLRT